MSATAPPAPRTAADGSPGSPRRLRRALLLGAALLLLAVGAATAYLTARMGAEVFAVERRAAVEPASAETLADGAGDVAVTDITYPSGRGQLPALLAQARGTTWAVLVHDKDESPRDVLPLARETVAAGMPTLAIGYRNDPGTPADPSGRHRYGQSEWRDLEAAVAYATGEGAEGVVLAGEGMGGSVVAAYLENAERAPGLVRGVVLDGPVLDLRAVADLQAERAGLPGGLPAPGPLRAVARVVGATAFDVDWDAVDYLDDTSWLQVPALVVHAAGDPTVPVATSRALVTAEPSLVQLRQVEGADASDADPEGYAAAVEPFLRTIQP